MSSAVSAPMRTAGWNVRLTIGTRDRPHEFAGVYQNPRAPTLTFADICAELALCFKLPGAQSDTRQNSDDTVDSWANSVAFALTDAPEDADATSYPSFITRESLHKVMPGLSSPSMRQPRTVTYHIVLHRSCILTAGLLEDHLQAQCAHYLPEPRRFRHPSYLPYNKTPSDPRLNMMPLRRKLKARSQSPPKRTSGSTSPNKQGDGEPDNDYADMIAPASLDIDLDAANKKVNEFRMACIAQATCCAVSGDGEPWSLIQHIGPGVQACHIVPQQHYHLYPMEHDDGNDASQDSARRLCQAWHMTWSADNGILLMKHLHDFFDTRLFSIHPTTLRIRVFVPYKSLEPYHGKKAQVARSVDRMALRHHYDMCCIENMAAKRPTQELASPDAASGILTSGTSLIHTSSGGSMALSGRTDLPTTPGSGHTPTQTAPGDPSKRRRPVDDDDTDEYDDDDVDIRKRVRREEQYGFDSYITQYNSRAFLADVNFELRRLQEPN
ncbi:hypothetical protein NHJ13734_007201 [Beauveria thailandica]